MVESEFSPPITIVFVDEDGEEYNDEDSGVESGFGRDSPRPQSPPPPQKEYVVRNLPWTPKVGTILSTVS